MSVEEQINNLNQAKTLVSTDPKHYALIVPEILPIAQGQESRLRQWCASFLLDCFTCDELDIEIQRSLAIKCLDTLLLLINITKEKRDNITEVDFITVKLAITCCSCIYPFLFSYVCGNSGEAAVWKKCVQMKSQILTKWDSGGGAANINDENSNQEYRHFGIQAACIKFAQQVISVQSYGSRDPRLNNRRDTDADVNGNENSRHNHHYDDVSLALVPPGHPLIEPTVEAEGLGLLDRMLSIFSEQTVNAPRITCTLNALFPLIRTRPSAVPKILRSLLNFDTATKSVSNPSYTELEFRFIDKTLKLLLTNVVKKSLAPKFSSQIQKYLSTLSQARASEKLKRRIGESAAAEQQQQQFQQQQQLEDEGDSNRKRIKPHDKNMPLNSSTTLPLGPVSYSSLFNLISPNDPLVSFDAKELPLDIAVNIALAGIAIANQQLLDSSINIVRSRYQNLQPTSSTYYPLDAAYDEDEDEDNDVDAIVAAQTQAETEAAGDSSEDEDEKEAALLPASSFSLDLPTKLNPDQRINEIGRVIDRLISYSSMSTTILSSGAANANKGLNRVALSEWNKDTWVIIASRIATRGACSSGSIEAKSVIRKHIFNYVMASFRDRLEVIISWLTEEWFHEFASSDTPPPSEEDSTYYLWTSQVFDQILPLIETDDTKGFIRLLSDLPALNRTLIFKIRSLCIDPYRTQIGFRAIRYLIKLKPPVKEFCLDLLEDLYKTEEDTQKVAGTILKSYRPAFFDTPKEEDHDEVMKEETRESTE